VRRAPDGERELVKMSWGFIFKPADGKGWRRVTNVRDDRVLKSKFWKPSFEDRRCLVPASSYCEPDSGKPAKWHWFAVDGGSCSHSRASGSTGRGR
jgi:putative SOS response-associated peptidase YedK